MSELNDLLSLSLKVSPEPSLKYDIIKSPGHMRTGSAFSKLKSNTSNKSKYTSNSKLTKSMLFKTIRGYN